tara:strand:- start:261 stop:944 length:684 start_codon:yes stop_codon:yes gene_type:complete
MGNVANEEKNKESQVKSGKKTKKNTSRKSIEFSNFNWTHKPAKDFTIFFAEEMFRNPDILAKKPNGIAIWYPKKNEKITINNKKFPNIFEEHWCRDEYIGHKCPAPHHDFFYSFIKINLNDKKWQDVLSVSGSVSYDPLKRLLSARCGSLEANIATLYTCLLVNNGVHTIKEIQSKGLYGKNINSTKDFESVKKMYKYLVKNLKKKDVPITGYWNVAFPKYAKSQKC